MQKNYTFSSRASESVFEAIFCFFESTSFEDAIRLAISIGGDSDTIAAITGSISEAFYGVPDSLKEKALSYLPEDYKKIIEAFYAKTAELSSPSENQIPKTEERRKLQKKLYE